MRIYVKIFIFLLSMPIYSVNAFYVGVGAHPNGFTGSAIDFLHLLEKYHINAVRLDYPWSDVERVKMFSLHQSIILKISFQLPSNMMLNQ